MMFVAGTEPGRRPTPLEMHMALARGRMPRERPGVVHAVEVLSPRQFAPRAACGYPAGLLRITRLRAVRGGVDWAPFAPDACDRCREVLRRRKARGEELEPCASLKTGAER